jgi:hypothetical protein
MTEIVLQRIKSQFASLQVKVKSALKVCHVELNDVHQFLVSFFQGKCYIPEATDLTKLFNNITENNLWSYDNYGPLQQLVDNFLPDDHPASILMNDYTNKLSGFYVTTKIVDFIDLAKFDDYDSDSEDHNQSISMPNESDPKKFYRELKIKLHLNRKVKLSDMTMSYVDTLWKALIKEFNLPPLTAIIKSIVPGSLIITWLVPPQVSAAILASHVQALKFYQQHDIVEIKLDDDYLYHESWIVSFG